MNRRILVGCLLAPFSLFCVLPAAAEPYVEDPYYCEDNGHYYEVVQAPKIKWDDAALAAAQREFHGAIGQLATIDSFDEDMCVKEAWKRGKPRPTEVWIGGFQIQIEGGGPGDGWTWINGEGAISTTEPSEGSYSNWRSGEPNDHYSTNSEQHLAVGLGGVYGWNDEGGPGIDSNIGGYLVEYEPAVPFSAADCNPCEYEGLEYTMEPEATTITFQSFLRTDDDDLCGIEPRDFTFPTLNGPIHTTMAKHLCGVKNETGKRQFVAIVVSKDGPSSQAAEKAADVKTEPGEYFSSFLTCEEEISGDLTLQNIVHFATDDINEMPRKESSDSTRSCGSSRGKVKGTIIFIGTQYVFKHPDYEIDWTPHAEFVEQAFIDIARDRVEDLIKAIDNAKPGVPRKHLLRWFSMRVAAGLALWSHDQGYYSIARSKVNFVNQVLPKISFNVKAGSAPAFIDIWGSHLIFMYAVKVEPFAAGPIDDSPPS